MAKKRETRKTSGSVDEPRESSAHDQVATAAAAVEQAREALRRAQQAYQHTYKSAAKQAAKTRAVTIGDILDGTLEFVRRHPAAGVFAAGLIGFLFGRSKIR